MQFGLLYIIAYTAATLIVAHTADAASTDKLMEVPASLFTLADGGIGDWFGGLLYSAGQQANEAVQDQLSALSFTRALQRSSLMDVTLSKAHCVYPDCNAMVKKLCAMTYNDEELVLAQKKETNFLVQLVGRTTPKGLHCLSMRLTAEYFALEPENIKILSQKDLHDADSYHFAVFSDNVLACSVVVQSTIATARKLTEDCIEWISLSEEYGIQGFPTIKVFLPGKPRVDYQGASKMRCLEGSDPLCMSKCQQWPRKILEDDIKVPCGRLVPSQHKDSVLEYNEYDVYDPQSVSIRFLVKVKFEEQDVVYEEASPQ
ncbi:hypothetical protein POM88_013182 [Heracleum sosnowskyi]|uniref:PARP catalytic domain-containing protein n=1 Tax=Heracleum sosnowskyi TaxID=360622 RepID=A0AAD8N318_9APIA|nr:hypothetical protein POM88_013182 [Heracleum sosnowskyi]